MADKIKCTYDDCFRHFKTVEAMKKHKAKDDAHDYYCKKCDLDCEDDTELLYHEITSSRHICCPVCGRDFKSEAGRDRHVEIEHVPKQSITCVGCRCKFDRAYALMRHIEQNECSVIKVHHFHRQRAEKQISKDAWNAALDPTAGSTILSTNAAQPSATADLTLLDDERAWVQRNWKGEAEFDPDNEQNGPYVPSRLDMDEVGRALPITDFPALRPQPNHPAGAIQSTNPRDSDLGHVTDQQRIQQRGQQPASEAWGLETSSPQMFSPQGEQYQTNSQVSTNLLDGFKDDDNQSGATWGTRYEHTVPDRHRDSIQIPTTLLNTNPDAHIQTVHSIQMPSYIQTSRFWDPVQEVYTCPGQKCGAKIATIGEFKDHLLSGVHVNGQVSCPGCLKKFKTTAALIAHCESGSRKCKIKHALDYDLVIKEVTAGILAADGYLEDNSVKYTAQEIHQW